MTSPFPRAGDWPGKLRIRHQGQQRGVRAASAWDVARDLREYLGAFPRAPSSAANEIRDGRGGGARPAGQTQTVVSGGFRVEEFRVPLMRATLKPPADPLVAASEFPLDISVQYLAGGGASKQPVTVRAQISPRALPTFDLFATSSSPTAPLAPGITAGRATTTSTRTRGIGRRRRHPGPGPPRPRACTSGARTSPWTPLVRRAFHHQAAALTRAQDVLTEVEFRDPTARCLTSARACPSGPQRWLVGVRASRGRPRRTISG